MGGCIDRGHESIYINDINIDIDLDLLAGWASACELRASES